MHKRTCNKNVTQSTRRGEVTDNTARRIMPTPQAEWMFELIVALKDQIEDLRLDRDTWRTLVLFLHKESGEAK